METFENSLIQFGTHNDILKVVINTIWNTIINELLYYTAYKGKDKGNI
jgi:hypothetical protein